MSTIRDVAKACHVSISTVSRALNGYNDISNETKKLVIDVARKLEYVPNRNAVELVKKNNKKLVIIARTLDEEYNLFDILRGLYNYAEEIDYEVLLFTLVTSIKKGKSYYEFCRENNIEGALMYGIHTNDPFMEELIRKDFPSVFIDCDVVGENTGNISIDNYEAAYEEVSYLISRGCKNIVTIQGGKDSYVTKERVKGYKDALNDGGILLDETNIYYSDFSESVAKDITLNIMKNKKIDSIFCGADSIATGVYSALKKLKIMVPNDVSVVGFGDNSIAKNLTPPLTTIRQNMYEFGYSGGKLLYKLINNKKASNVIRIKYEFIKRESVI
ncbi:LacI family DNA-binding transcriptional regulator [Clostridium sp. MB40-C1]|uniref:LacI family DNA-binding transcriptional regulator n=1 Tax=Clostridium sp. MB40-C1 TaxID=3070996 RepID=UPI0027E02D85|nr:LacI family DNA-binding transcriptional regulator [Clostridium sp. MB40-C1]WMJ81513.1 LacI family DNA-binding transcriptional regulator [Clostridium sp. MB40-C1]